MSVWRPLVLFLSAMLVAGCISSPVEDAPPTPSVAWRPVDEARLTPGGASASEVSIAVDPTDPRHLVAAANSGGGFGLYASFDAGGNWSVRHFPPDAVDPDGVRFSGLSDPVVAFGADGTLYVAGLAYLPSSAVFVAVGRSGGIGDLVVHVAHESDLASSFNDKEWLAVDARTGTLILTWQKEPAMDQLRMVENTLGGIADLDRGDIVVSRSTDHGATWSEPMKVSRGMHNNGTQVAWSPDGSAHLLWVNYEEATLDHTVSTDGGLSWAVPQAVTDVQIVPAFARYTRMHTLPAFVASPVDPSLYAVWHDERNGDADIMAVASPDGGRTWGEAVRVNQDTLGGGAIQMYPWAAVDPDGRLHVTFYDAREDPYPRFVVRHAVAEDPGLRFNETGIISDVPFTAFNAPDGSVEEARGLGDYTGLAASERGVFPAWADGRGDESAIHAVRLLPPATE